MRPFLAPAFALALSLLLGIGPAAAQPPDTLVLQGLLQDTDSAPVAGPVDLEVEVWDAAAGGSRLYRETHVDVPLRDGVLAIALGSGSSPQGSFDAALFSDPERFLQLIADGETLTPRSPITSVAFALQSGNCRTLDGLRSDAFIRTSGGVIDGALGFFETPAAPDLRQQISSDGITLTLEAFSFPGAGAIALDAESNIEIAAKDQTFISGSDGLVLRSGNGDILMSVLNGDVKVDGNVVHASDRARKRDITPVDAPAILERVAALPIHRWVHESDPRGTPHIGPMAQDFHAAFGVGSDERYISAVDADGVALAAIGALARSLAERDVRLERLSAAHSALAQRNRSLEQRLLALERRLDAEDPAAAR